jgi:hypothetical protein
LKIEQINVGFPVEVGTDLKLTILPFVTDAITTKVHYCIQSSKNKSLAQGIINLTPEEYSSWGFDNLIIENIILERLGLTRLVQ